MKTIAERYIAGYEGLYRISIFGEVWSYRINRYLKQQISNKGYPYVNLYSKDKGKKLIKVHRLVASSFIPNPNNYNQINHKDGVKTNNHVSNLEWVSSSSNMKHAYEHGLMKNCRGSADKLSKKVINTQTGEVFGSIREAARNSLKYSCSHFSRMLNGKKRNTSPYRLCTPPPNYSNIGLTT